jgi:probable F420-dependent oxidoreductase
VYVKFGVGFTGRGPLSTPDRLLRLAEAAERLGYDSFFVGDHVVLPSSARRSTYPYSVTGQMPGGAVQDCVEPITVLAWLAQATAKIAIGVSVLVVPCRNPLLTAKMLATVDVLSGGRVILGAGIGWLREEFAALQAPDFEARGRVTDEYLALMRRAWTTDPVSFEGHYYRVEDVHLLPKPVQRGGIPIWIGGHSPAAVRRAGRLGDAWHPIGLRAPARLDPPEYAMKVTQLHGAAREAGRNAGSIALTFYAFMEVRSPCGKGRAGDQPLLQGTPAEVIADIRAYQAVGVTHFVFSAMTHEMDTVLDNMKRFAEDVRPHVEDQGT